MARFRWAILGTGNIARQFAASFATSDRGEIVAVGSRSVESAREFAARFATHALCGGYAEVIRADQVDGVYVSLPNNLHAEWTIAALRQGKHVLCEKPLAMTEAEGRTMFAEAKSAGRLLVEAFMYVSHPLTKAYLGAIRAGEVGRVRHVRTSFCYRTAKVAGNVRFEPGLGGGALYDIGCYCLHFSRMVAGNGVADPVAMSAQGSVHASGVDDVVSVLMRFPGDVTASFTAGMTLQADNTATVSGTDAYIEVPVPWKPPKVGARYVVARSTPPKMDGGGVTVPPRTEVVVDAGKDLYALEADDFAAATLGETPPAVTEADSMANLRMMDTLRRMIRP
jgi:D-xylose 1-dehydrogenase (NADP+, D-xylono-1,5-lactone-forming)